MTTVEERIFRNVHEIVAEVQEEQPRGLQNSSLASIILRSLKFPLFSYRLPVLGEVNPVGASDEGPEEKPILYPGEMQP